MEGFRMARAGEFTERAFWNSKLDIGQVEGLGDLLNAETSRQRDLALSSLLEKRFTSVLSKWRDDIVRLLALTEAWIDFGDEENIEVDTLPRIISAIDELSAKMQKQLDKDQDGELIRGGVQIALVGAPNVGKSSLLNALVGRKAAIVSPTPGTTRDPIRVTIMLAGYSVTLTDTAGYRESNCEIEKEGISMGLESAEQADYVLYMIDASNPQIDWNHLSKFKNHLLVINKSDLSSSTNVEGVKISCAKNEITPLIDTLTRVIKERLDPVAHSDPILVRSKHMSAVKNCISHLQNSRLILINQSVDSVVAAEYLRKCAVEIGRLTGQIDPEQVLNVLFSSFCIGK